MAITFSTGTINQPDAGSVGLAMVEKIRDELVAHASWDLVEEFTPASGLVRWYVFRAIAAGTGLPADWYLIIGRTLGNGELRFWICEAYNSTTKAASYYCNGAYYPIDWDSEGRPFKIGAANIVCTLGTAVVPATPNYGPMQYPWIPSGTSTKWWIIVTNDTFTVAFNGASNGFIHAGSFIPLTSMAWPMPIQIIGSDGGYGSLTRNPSIPNAANLSYYALIFRGGNTTSHPQGYANSLGFNGHLRYNDKLQGGQRPVAEIGMTIAEFYPDAASRSLYGWAVGKQKNMRAGEAGSVTPGFAFGDAYVLQNRLWVPYRPDDNRVWDTGVAAA